MVQVSSWLTAVEDGVITVVAADSVMDSICGYIGRGLMVPMKTLDINASDWCYCGIKAIGYTKDLGKVPGSSTGFSIHDVLMRADFQMADGQQSVAEQAVKDAIAQMAFVIGAQRMPNPFGVRSSTYITTDLEPGSGLVNFIQNPEAAEEDTDLWVVEGEYVFTVRTKLKIRPTI